MTNVIVVLTFAFPPAMLPRFLKCISECVCFPIRFFPEPRPGLETQRCYTPYPRDETVLFKLRATIPIGI